MERIGKERVRRECWREMEEMKENKRILIIRKKSILFFSSLSAGHEKMARKRGVNAAEAIKNGKVSSTTEKLGK